MRCGFFSAKSFERDAFQRSAASEGPANGAVEMVYFEVHLNRDTAKLAEGMPVVCAFVSDNLNAEVIEILKKGGTRLIALRSAGYNHVDLLAAKKAGLLVVRVPAYSPFAVAEHTVALMLTLNRKIHRAYNRVREGNFSLQGLVGFDMNTKTVGLIGVGKIGAIVAKILSAFGCRILAYDICPSDALRSAGVEFCDLDEVCRRADILSLHCPLTSQTRHLIDESRLRSMKKGVMMINTSRGALIDTSAMIQALKSEQVGSLGLDVYEEEEDLFFEDKSEKVIGDDIFMRLLTFPNVIVTGHQAFLTQTALDNIAQTTLKNIEQFQAGASLVNLVS